MSYSRYHQDKYGWWKRQRNIRSEVANIALFAFLLLGIIWLIAHPDPAGAEVLGDVHQEVGSQDAPTDCRKVGGHEWDCGDQDLRKKLEVMTDRTYLAGITEYSRRDSCHNMKGNLCLTAIGRDTKEGVTVACPKRLKLMTRVRIEGIGERVCEDRYANWVQAKHGDTFDVFTEDYKEAVRFGRKTLEITVL